MNRNEITMALNVEIHWLENYTVLKFSNFEILHIWLTTPSRVFFCLCTLYYQCVNEYVSYTTRLIVKVLIFTETMYIIVVHVYYVQVKTALSTGNQ